tara:strand:- start:26487 stop:26861 length:375 start_codon:yes stop_codon:yes gene_type:complete
MSGENEQQSEYPVPLDNAPWELAPETVHQLMQKEEDFLLIDCRTAMEWEDGSIDNALNLPLQQFSTRFNELEAHRDKPIVIFCRTGSRSVIVAKFLRLAGFEHVRSMSGGYEAWGTLPTTTGAS